MVFTTITDTCKKALLLHILQEHIKSTHLILGMPLLHIPHYIDAGYS